MPHLPSLPPRLPSDVLASLDVRSGEKVVAWGTGPVDARSEIAHVVATDRALYLSSPVRRIPWSRIARATWEEPVLALAVLDDAGRVGRPLEVPMDASGDVPAAVHDRVTASVVISQRVDLDGFGSALMVARRGSDDEQITWSVVFDAGLDPADPRLRAAADIALARLRDALGI
jgi:hypothetical protein